MELRFDFYADVVLACDLSEHRLRRGDGDMVKLIEHHVVPEGTEDYSMEAFITLGSILTATNVPSTALGAVR